MNPYALPPFVAACLNGVLIVWVFAQAAPGILRRTFIGWNIFLALWNIGIGVGYSISDPLTAQAWYKLVSSCVIAGIAPFFLHFVLAVTGAPENKLNRWFLRVGYASIVVFGSVGALTDLLMQGVQHYHWGYYPIAGKGEGVFGLFYTATVAYAFWNLIQALPRTNGYQRNQIKYVLGGAAVCFLSGFTNFLPLYGRAIYPMGNLMNSVYSLLVAYAIIEYELMDIRVVLRRSAVYGLLSGALTAVYLSLVMVFERLFGHYGLDTEYVYYTAAVPITIALAPPMKARLESLIESVPFWKTHRYTEVLGDFGRSVLTILDLPTAARRVIEKMCALVDASAGAVYLRRPVSGSFARTWHQGKDGPALLESAHPLVRYLQSGKTEFLKEKALWESQLGQPRFKDGESGEWLDAWPYALALPLLVKQRFFGIIVLGDKATGDMFNGDDLRLLKMLAVQAAVALSNAQGFAELEVRQKALKDIHDNALIGVLATEIAHEVTKPLTRIINERTRLEAAMNSRSHQSLKKIEREALRAAEIMEGFAMLSPNVPLRRTRASLAVLMEEALNALGIEQDQDIRVEREFDTVPPVPLNPGQILQVMTNIIQNAWQAVPEGGVLTLSTRSHHAQGEAFVEASVSNTGPGIPSELQDQVFEPFFTTKQATGGRGVGLTLSRAMVERHGGTIIIQSPLTPAGGTRVVVRLPVVDGEQP